MILRVSEFNKAQELFIKITCKILMCYINGHPDTCLFLIPEMTRIFQKHLPLLASREGVEDLSVNRFSSCQWRAFERVNEGDLQ